MVAKDRRSAAAAPARHSRQEAHDDGGADEQPQATEELQGNEAVAGASQRLRLSQECGRQQFLDQRSGCVPRQPPTALSSELRIAAASELARASRHAL